MGPGFAAHVDPRGEVRGEAYAEVRGAARVEGSGMAAGGPLLRALARNWLLVLLRGACAIGFGIYCFLEPRATLRMLVMLYGAYAIFDGMFALAAAVMGGQVMARWWLAAAGVIGITAGIMVMIVPLVTMMMLVIFIACWAIAVGVMQVIGAVKLRREIHDEWALGAAGAASIVFGLIPMVEPAVGALGLSLVIGVYAAVHGVILVALALRLSGHGPNHSRGEP